MVDRTITIVQRFDLDDETVTVSQESKIGSKFILEEQAKVVQISEIKAILWRRARNSNKKVFPTGWLTEDGWFGDSPDGETHKDPFTGEVVPKGAETTPPDVTPTPEETTPPEFSWDKVSATIDVDSSGVNPPFVSPYHIRFYNGNAQTAQAEIIATVTSGNGTINGGNTVVPPTTSAYSNTMSTPDWGDVPSEYNIKVKVTYNGESRIVAETSGTMSAVLH